MTLIDTVQLQEMESAFVSLFVITLANQSSTTIYLAQGLEEGSQNLYFGSRPTIAVSYTHLTLPTTPYV